MAVSDDFFEVEVDVPTTAKLQDVWVTPSMADRDGNNLLVYSPNADEGYDGLRRVVIDPNAASELDMVFNTLMGDQVEPRREFIQQNAQNVFHLFLLLKYAHPHMNIRKHP